MNPAIKSFKDTPSVRVYFGDLRKMTSTEVADGEVSLIVTSPPYFNAPFDYPDLFPTYNDYLDLIRSFASQSKRVLERGRICAIVTDDMLVKSAGGGRGRKYPLVADTTRIFLDEGFLYRDKITWVKPTGYTRISRRSGVVLQHPYPMYYYPDNIQESILLFQNGEFDYRFFKDAPRNILELSKIDTVQLNKERWNLTVWNITNVLPMPGRVEEGIAAFPEEIPRRLIKLFTMVAETVFDPFAGSGTTLKAAKVLGRKAIGYEIDVELKKIMRKKLGGKNFVSEDREGAKRLRKSLQTLIHQQRSVAKPRVMG
jgi:site-specific DNA-methyltransferase (adenine-specific)